MLQYSVRDDTVQWTIMYTPTNTMKLVSIIIKKARQLYGMSTIKSVMGDHFISLRMSTQIAIDKTSCQLILFSYTKGL